jgi:hypothetical protein
MPTLQHRPADLPTETPGEWPLLVLDAEAFLTWCRRCGWKSTRESTLAAALAAFDTHTCEEPPA